MLMMPRKNKNPARAIVFHVSYSFCTFQYCLSTLQPGYSSCFFIEFPPTDIVSTARHKGHGHEHGWIAH